MIKKAFAFWIVLMSLSLQARAYEGVIKFYNNSRGFGFVTPTSDSAKVIGYKDRVFVAASLLNLTEDVDVFDLHGYCVRFDLSDDPQGTVQAPDLDMSQTLYAINVYLIQDCKTSL
ncbi:MAG: hypothetical protein M9899_09845 [Bdellovibrionaceae bacterium]|nr:hypothetical protein [Pseudobdellovibrionaceae bacterium]